MNSLGFTNSLITCLHIPQGKALSYSEPLGSTPTLPPHTAIATNFFSPSETALNIAVLSAQFPAGYDAFSILKPPYIFPVSDKIAAPT